MAIESACRDGYRYYYMRILAVQALLSFKSKFGAHDYAEYWMERVPIYRANAFVRDGDKRIITVRDA